MLTIHMRSFSADENVYVKVFQIQRNRYLAESSGTGSTYLIELENGRVICHHVNAVHLRCA